MKQIRKDEIPNDNLPRLVFMCANNHMYPVIDEEHRETIFKTSSTIGDKINKYRAQQKIEHKIKYGTEHHIYIHLNDVILWVVRTCPNTTIRSRCDVL